MSVKRVAACDLPNSEYHAPTFEGESYFSSSQLKKMLEAPELFHEQYILGNAKPMKQSDALVIGSYYHAGVLEPHLLGEEFAVYDGKVRRGSAWDKFQQDNQGKEILSQANIAVADSLIQATMNNERTMELLAEGEPEVSFFGELEGVKVKIRFDFLNPSYGLDLKSTGKNAKSVYDIQSSMESFNYDLSAALYMDLYNVWAAENNEPRMTEFYWPFASKSVGNCQVYKATSDLIRVGRLKYKKALNLIKEHTAAGWVFEDTIEELTPMRYVCDNWLTDSPKKEVQKHPEKQPPKKSELEDLL